MPYTFTEPSGGGTLSKDSSVNLTFQFSYPNRIRYYSLMTNALRWSISVSLDNISWTVLDTRDEVFSSGERPFTLSAETDALYVKLNITRANSGEATAKVYSLIFYDPYKRRLHPKLIQNSSYYLSEYIGSAQPGVTKDINRETGIPSTWKVVHFRFEIDVIPKYVYGVNGTIQQVNISGQNVYTGTNAVNDNDTSGKDVYIYYTGTDSLFQTQLFDANHSPLTDPSWIGGSVRNGWDEWVEMTFQQPISANSYSFTTPSSSIYPTWFQIQGFDTTWRLLDERKWFFDSYKTYSSLFTQNLKPYSKYRILIKATRHTDVTRSAAELIQFNVYDSNGCEFIQSLGFPNDGRTNAQIVTCDTGFVEGTISSIQSSSITFTVPVTVFKIIVPKLIGTISIQPDSGAPILIGAFVNDYSSTPITGRTFTVRPVSNPCQYGVVQFYGTRGRLNPFVSSISPLTYVNAYGGKSINEQSISIVLNSSQPLYGQHYIIDTTGGASIVSYELYGIDKLTNTTTLLKSDTSYSGSQSIRGDFTRNKYDSYKLKILEIESTSKVGYIDISNMKIFSETYTSIVPAFTSSSLSSFIPQFSISLEGTYAIDKLTTDATALDFTNLFDGNINTVFKPSYSSTCTFNITFPNPVMIKGCAVTGGSAAGSPTTWTLSGISSDGSIIQLMRMDSLPVYDYKTQSMFVENTTEYIGAQFSASTSTGQNLEIVDLKLFNPLGEFIPRIRFDATTLTASTGTAQLLYGGTTTVYQNQSMEFSFPVAIAIRSIEFVGNSLPSNISVYNNTTLLFQGDSFFDRCIFTSDIPSPSLYTTYKIYINRLRSNTTQVQYIDVNDILFKDLNGYIVTPNLFPTFTTDTQTQKGYTIINPSRTGYIFTVAPQSRITIDNLTTFTGYRGKFKGVRQMRVSTGGTTIHLMTFQTPFANTFTYSSTPVSLENNSITFDFLSTFEGFSQISIGNLNIFNIYREPYLHTNVSSTSSRSFITGGDCSSTSLSLGDLAGEAVSFIYPPSEPIPTQSAQITTNYPAHCVVLGLDSNNSFIPLNKNSKYSIEYGTYVVSDALGVNMFRGGVTQFNDNQSITIQFPRSFYVNEITIDLPTNYVQTDLDINGILSTTISKPNTSILLNSFTHRLVFTCKYKQSTNRNFSIGLGNVKINNVSLIDGILDGNIITYIPSNTINIPFDNLSNYERYMIKCIRYYNDVNSGDGTITFSGTTVLTQNGDIFNNFTSNRKDDYAYPPSVSIPNENINNPLYLEMKMDRLIQLNSVDTYEIDHTYSDIDKTHLEASQDGINWYTVSSFPSSGIGFRRYIDRITDFKQGGRVKINNWSLEGYPRVLGKGDMTGNVIASPTVREYPSFGQLNLQLIVNKIQQS